MSRPLTSAGPATPAAQDMRDLVARRIAGLATPGGPGGPAGGRPWWSSGRAKGGIAAAIVAMVAALLSCAPVADRAPHERTTATTTSPSGNGQPDGTAAGVTVEEEPPAAVSWSPLGEPGVGGWITGLAIDPFDPQHFLASGDMLGAANSIDGGLTWSSTFGLTNAEMARFTFHPTRRGEVWVGTMGGPYVSTDGGVTWQERRSGMPALLDVGYSAPIELVAVDSADPNRLMAFGGSHRQWESLGTPAWGAVWLSTDGGASWAHLSTVADGANIVDATYLADGTLLVAALDRGVYHSADGGRTWERWTKGLPHVNVRALAAHPSDANVVWLALGASTAKGQDLPGGVYRSGDGGRSWAPASTGLDLGTGSGGSLQFTAQYPVLVVARDDPDVLYTANTAWGSEAVYRSNDGGASWTQAVDRGLNRPITAYSTPVTASVIALDPTDADQVLIGNSEFILHTTDGGGRWQDVTSDVQADGSFAGRGYSGLVASRLTFSPDGQELILCGFDGANPLISGAGTDGWARPLVSRNAWGGCIDAAYGATDASKRFVLLGQNGIFGGLATIEGDGERFSVAAGEGSGLPAQDSQIGDLGAVESVALPGGGEVTLLTVGGTLYASSDGGHHWEQRQGGLSLGELAADPAHPGRLYVAGAAGVYFSGDAGLTMRLLANSPLDPERMALDPTTGAVYATVWRTEGAGLWRMTGEAWARLLQEPTTFDVAVDPRDPAHLLVATNDHPFHDRVVSVGMLSSADGGATWTTVNDGLPLLRVAAVAFDPADPGRVVIGTFGRGFFQSASRR